MFSFCNKVSSCLIECMFFIGVELKMLNADCTFLSNYQLAEIMIIQLKLTNQMSTVPVKNDIFVGQTMDNK